jgi:hypothetical protein|tara:strand:+ start:410 stop:604 length:195 start_codon:yes stop_codon:yes gene_type:complete
MDYYVSKDTLDCFEKVVYDINIKLLKEIHKKYLKDLDFEELTNILDGVTKKTYTINVSDSEDED